MMGWQDLAVFGRKWQGFFNFHFCHGPIMRQNWRRFPGGGRRRFYTNFPNWHEYGHETPEIFQPRMGTDGQGYIFSKLPPLTDSGGTSRLCQANRTAPATLARGQGATDRQRCHLLAVG
jgi:hypothetical protein